MSVSFSVQSSTGSYDVEIQAGSFAGWAEQLVNSAVIADLFFKDIYPADNKGVLFVEAVETNKALEASPALIESLRHAGVNRSTSLAAVGGGIIQDLSAFIASVYMRGLNWTYFPTTVLAMVDSCIGGKSSINVGPYKNLVGTFHPPMKVLIDPAFVHTLPVDQRASGLIEAVKICFCRGEEAFSKHMSFKPAVDMPIDALEGVIANSLLSKKWFIEIDEFDHKERLLLNFGHTFGHAIEGASHFAIAHGIAVGLGIECAIAFEQSQGIDYANVSRVGELQAHLRQMLSAAPSIAEELRKLDLDDILDRIRSDKKHGADFYTLILIADDGDVVLRRLPKTESTLTTIRNAVQKVIVDYSRAK